MFSSVAASAESMSARRFGIGLSTGLSPDPKRREQSRSVVNEIVGGVHNEVVRGVRRPGPDVRPNLLLRLLLQLTESAHALAVFHRAASAITRRCSSSPR